jgi:[ribosomal protein S18]-alanine N-acetyltransferase
MSAVLQPRVGIEDMTEEDLGAVIAIEQRIYDFPWTVGNFRDSIRAGYHCWILRGAEGMIGYCVAGVAAGEAHLLNLSVDEPQRGRGFGRMLLARVIELARENHAGSLFLEVRPSNEDARRLYANYGFKSIGVRRDYYPAQGGREDALVLSLEL